MGARSFRSVATGCLATIFGSVVAVVAAACELSAPGRMARLSASHWCRIDKDRRLGCQGCSFLKGRGQIIA